MQLPLFVQAKPTLNGFGPLIFVPEGTWMVESNHSDSELNLILNHSTIPLSSKDITFEGPTTAQLHVVKVGCEPQLTIYAVRQ